MSEYGGERPSTAQDNAAHLYSFLQAAVSTSRVLYAAQQHIQVHLSL